MDCIAIKLNPELLTNPDADMRYVLPDLLTARSGGVIQDDGYDYVGTSNQMVVYLQVTDLEKALACISDVIANVRVLENDLRPATTVAVRRGEGYDVIHPADSNGEFVV